MHTAKSGKYGLNAIAKNVQLNDLQPGELVEDTMDDYYNMDVTDSEIWLND